VAAGAAVFAMASCRCCSAVATARTRNRRNHQKPIPTHSKNYQRLHRQHSLKSRTSLRRLIAAAGRIDLNARNGCGKMLAKLAPAQALSEFRRRLRAGRHAGRLVRSHNLTVSVAPTLPPTCWHDGAAEQGRRNRHTCRIAHGGR
jgi:hypothetical protein